MSSTLAEYFQEQISHLPDRTYERSTPILSITTEERERASLVLHREDFLPPHTLTLWHLMKKIHKDELYERTGCKRCLPKRSTKKEMLGWILWNHCQTHAIPLSIENYIRAAFLSLEPREPKFNWFSAMLLSAISTDLFQ